MRDSLQADSRLRVAVVRIEKFLAEVGDRSGTQSKRNVHHWKTLPSTALKTVTENTRQCVTVICKV
jgi:hypothetical protein